MIRGVSETIGNKAKEQNDGFLDKLLGKLVASLLGNILTGKRVKQSKTLGREANVHGQGVIRKGF